MVPFYGDYDTTETVYLPFNTFDSNDPSASVTITNLVAGDIDIHKDGGLTQRSSAAGITVSVDFDGITGNHLVAIDLSDNTDAGFYADGSTYQVRMEGTTVDAGTINAWIGSFSVGRMLRPTTAGRTLDVASTGEAGVDFSNINGTLDAADIGTDAITAAKIATDAVEEIADQVWDEVLTGGTHNVANSAGRRLRQLQEAGAYAGAIWIDTVNGTAGTTSFENGTDTNPVDTIADANTPCGCSWDKSFQGGARKLNHLCCGSDWSDVHG